MADSTIRIAILGGKGMLGSDVAVACRESGLEPAVFDLPDFDITDTRQLRQVISDSDVLVNCAAYTDVDGAQSQTELAYAVNAEAVGHLGRLAKKAGKWVLHISTDFVFDGRKGTPYVETDVPNPINKYGASKLAGERLLVESGCHNCIIRVEWTYGRNGRNFVTKLIERAKTGGTLKVVDDQKGSPTATTQIAKAICKLVRKKPQGLFHFASSGYVGRFEMAEFIFDKLGMAVDLRRCKTADYKAPAARSLNSCFDCGKIASLLDEPIEKWQGPLERFLRQL
jgi:dTDP-4-dehydrorhamnose reductase